MSGAHAIGGMAAFIPSRRDAEVNEVALARVTEDKRRESEDGFDVVPGWRTQTSSRSRWPSSTPCSASARTSWSGCATT